MNGGQDLGGTHGHGPVKPEPNEPVFHGDWEKRAFALTMAMAMPGGWNIDMSRFARENRPPGEYLSMTYYQIWFAALETMLKERGLVAEDEIAAGAPDCNGNGIPDACDLVGTPFGVSEATRMPFTGSVFGCSSMKEKRRRMAASIIAMERSAVFMVPMM